MQRGNTINPVAPADGNAVKTGTIKAGTYDVLMTLGTPGRLQKVWLENFLIKPDISYNITCKS